MSFLNILFPEDISYGAVGGPQFFTTISTTQDKTEFRSANWSSPRMQYSVQYGLKNKQQIQNLVSFFYIVQGCSYVFRYKDWLDFSASNQALGVGDGEVTAFQIIKTYCVGNANSPNYMSYIRQITKPVSGTVTVKQNGIEVDDTQYTIDYTTGIITFIQPPAPNDAISADFQFHVPVRFASDVLQASMDADNFYNSKEITLIEVNA